MKRIHSSSLDIVWQWQQCPGKTLSVLIWLDCMSRPGPRLSDILQLMLLRLLHLGVTFESTHQAHMYSNVCSL